MRFVEETEARHLHQVDTVGVLDLDVEIPHDEGGEIKPSHLEEQLVLIERVRMVGKDEKEFLVAVGCEFAGSDGIAVAQYGGASAPHIFQVKLPSVKLPASLHTVDDHASHLADAAAGEILHHEVHVVEASVGIIGVEAAQAPYEDKLVAVGTHGETRLRQRRVAEDLLVAVGFEGTIGRRVERVLDVLTKLGVLHIVGVGEYGGPLTLGELLFEQIDVRLRFGRVALAGVQQEEVIIHFIHLLELRIIVGQAVKLLFAEAQVVEFVLEDDTGMIQSVGDDGMAFGFLLLLERNLLQVILPFVRIILRTVLYGGQRVLRGFHGRIQGVCDLVLWVIAKGQVANDGFVGALPVVLILSFSPLLLESGFTL